MLPAMAGQAPAQQEGGQQEGGRLAQVFQDKMVLQRGKAVPVWGWAKPGAKVMVSFAGQQARTTAADDGTWKVSLEPLSASAKGQVLTARIGDQTRKLKDVLVGEVWIASGQSNMNTKGPDKDTGLYPHYQSPGTGGGMPEIRVDRFGWGASLKPLSKVVPSKRGQDPWKVLPENPPRKRMNLAQYFARIVRDKLEVPVGIVHVAVSGTNQAAWMAKSTLEQFDGNKNYDNYYQQFLAEKEAQLAKKDKDIQSFEAYKQALAKWRQTRNGPGPGRGLNLKNYPSALYNTRIAPLAPLAVRGVIWHQGEAGPGGPYGRRLVAMANHWRQAFGQDFTFIFGTLSRNTNGIPPLEPKPLWFYRSSTNRQLRKARELFKDNGDKKVALVDLYDTGDNGTHFEQKAEAGRRMGLAAMNVAYGRKVIFTGPRKTNVKIEGNRALVQFTHVGSGLQYKPSLAGISGVIINDREGNTHWAKVKVVGQDTIAVSHPDVQKIKGVGYAVAPNPLETLFNSAGLPASAFRVNLGHVPWSGHAKRVRLLRKVGTDGKSQKIRVDMPHVRRTGYIFKLHQRANRDSKITVRAFVPDEWDGQEVRTAGQSIQAKPAPTESEDRQFIQFQAPTNQWIIIAAPGEAKSFDDINRY